MYKSFKNLCEFSRNKRIIGGNWKSNNTLEESKSLISSVINKMNYQSSEVDVIIAPINLHIPTVAQYLKHPNVSIAAQNASKYGYGAYTGEISPKHLKNFGCVNWVILGHSQRRTIMKQDDSLIVEKTELALQCGLKVIYCFGQTLQKRQANQTWQVLESQLQPLLQAFEGNSKNWTQNIVLAYEPVWAIGTGIASSPQQTQQVFQWLRKKLNQHIVNSDKVRIMYGGSANGKNAGQYMKIQSVDGLLVGGASLKTELEQTSFLKYIYISIYFLF